MLDDIFNIFDNVDNLLPPQLSTLYRMGAS
jgi:hypothetical protein